jgi:predicted lipid-binding transport protein (Tim44 family)
MKIDLILLAIIAGAIIFKLYNTMGKDLGDDFVQKEKIIDPIESEDVSEKDLALDSFPLQIQQAIKEMQRLEPGFSISKLLEKIEKVFEFTLEKLSKRDVAELRPITSEKVFNQFNKIVEELKEKNLFMNITLLSVSDIKMEEFVVEGDVARVTIKITSHQMCFQQDENGRKIKGDKNQVEKKEDFWSFTKKIDNKNKIWILEKTS